MSAGSYNFQIEQGADFTRDLAVSGLDLTGATARLQGRVAVTSTAATLDWTSTNGYMAITVTSSSAATVTLTATSTQTAAMTFDKLVYDLELVLSSSQVVRLLKGNILLLPEVTR